MIYNACFAIGFIVIPLILFYFQQYKLYNFENKSLDTLN